MSLKERIESDLTTSLKSGEKLRYETLKMVKSSIKNAEIENRGGIEKKGELEDSVLVDLLSREVKKRKEASESYKKGGREELARKEEDEIKILENYLPKQLSEDEVREAVKRAITEVGAAGPQDFGKVMGKAMAELKGKASGDLVSKILKEELN